MQKVNKPLLRKTLAYIKKHPKEWDQGEWRCASGMCFAGFAAFLAGGRWSNPDDPYDAVLKANKKQRWPEEHAASRAARLLGVSENAQLFAASNTLRLLTSIVKKLCQPVGH